MRLHGYSKCDKTSQASFAHMGTVFLSKKLSESFYTLKSGKTPNGTTHRDVNKQQKLILSNKPSNGPP